MGMKKRAGKSKTTAWRKPGYRRGKIDVTGDVQTLDIAYIGHRGDGIGWNNHEDGQDDAQGESKARYYVPYTVAGDTVRASVTGDRGNLVEIMTPGPDRISPLCPHFGSCGGCALQHLKQDAYIEWKQDVVVTALERQGLNNGVESLIDAHGTGRRRVTIHVEMSGYDVQAGFMRAKSRQLMAIDACPVLAPELSGCFQIARELGVALAGACRALDVQMTATSTGLDCNITGPGDLNYDQHVDLTTIAQKRELARLSVNGETVVEQRAPELIMGSSRNIVPPGGFLQATEMGEKTLSGLVVEHLGQAAHVADLFCGIGPFTLRLAHAAQVYAADSDASAIDALQRTANHSSGLKPISAVRRDLFSDPLTHLELNRFDAVVFDPPRAGAQKQVRELAQSTVGVVVAVSCDAASFARDARVLVEGGYSLVRVIPVDQFRWSAHVEIVGCFERR